MPELQSPTMRDPEEVQRAHDLLKALLNDEIPDTGVEGATNRDVWYAVLSAVCWMLGHEFGGLFEENIQKIENAIKASGFTFDIKPPDVEHDPPTDTIGPFSLN